MDKIKRCAWVPENNPLYQKYHDEEWGVPVHDDRTHFEFLILEGAQAGLSWETVLKKREGYRKAFHDFDVEKCARLSDEELEEKLQNPEIIRNRLKVFSVRKNAGYLSTYKRNSAVLTSISGVLSVESPFASIDNPFRKFLQRLPKAINYRRI